MSIQVMQAVWEHSKADGRARLVLLAIADHQGEIGAWPSIATIAKMVNASERSVQRDIKYLEDLGELKVEVQNAPTRNQYKSNLYWVTLPGTLPVTLSVTSGVTESQSGVTNNDSGVTDSTSGVTAGGVLTLKEPLLKPLLNSYRLPEDWQPRENDIETMREHFPKLDLKLETHAFRDYWRAVPGSRGKKSDWDATWRNWIRNSYKRSKPKYENNIDDLNVED
jgi:hypothetical protein